MRRATSTTMLISLGFFTRSCPKKLRKIPFLDPEYNVSFLKGYKTYFIGRHYLIQFKVLAYQITWTNMNMDQSIGAILLTTPIFLPEHASFFPSLMFFLLLLCFKMFTSPSHAMYYYIDNGNH